ncbi:MAG: hypothetical protein LBP40_04640 [Campylobacteraceae bacterium]|jgi:hypothetical protein|nr:hypothetical protein [Campylobacteraceae bacterium]
MTLHEYAAAYPLEYAAKAAEANASGKTLNIKNGELVLSTPAQNINELKAAKHAEIKAAHDAQINGSLVIGGIEWHCDFDTIVKLDYALNLAKSGGLAKVVYYDFHAVEHEYDLRQAQELIYAIGANFQALLKKRNALYQEIEKSASKKHLEKIIWGENNEL